MAENRATGESHGISKNVSRQFREMLVTPADFLHSSEKAKVEHLQSVLSAEDVMEIYENAEVALKNAYDQLPVWCRPDEKKKRQSFPLSEYCNIAEASLTAKG